MEKILKSSLFGYSKKSVGAYISGMNEEFSKKLLEKEQECRRTVQGLEEQLEALRQEKEQLQAGRQEVAGALIDAKTFAAELMARAEEENRVQRAKNQVCHQAELRRLQALSAEIDALRESFRGAIGRMDAEMERYSAECQAAQIRLEANMAAAEAGEKENEPLE